MTRRQLFACSALLLLAGCKDRHDAPVVSQAWVRLPAVAGQPAAAYFTIEGGGAADRLVRVETALAQRIDLHESMTGAHKMTTMAPVAAIAIPAGGKIAFAPGGKHAMVYGLEPVIVPGTAVPLRFGFASGKTAEAEAKSVAAGAGAPY